MKKFLCLILTICFVLGGCSKNNANEAVGKDSIEIPYGLDDGKVVILSLFESSTLNPDFNNEYGEDIASLEIQNQSSEYLKEATITMKMSDDMIYHFLVKDLPASHSIWVFEKENKSHLDTTISSIDYQTEYKENATLHEDEIQVMVDGFTVNLTNLTNHDISNITMKCHATLDSIGYGGEVYLYNVQLLPASQSVSFEATDCLMDGIEVIELDY